MQKQYHHLPAKSAPGIGNPFLSSEEEKNKQPLSSTTDRPAKAGGASEEILPFPAGGQLPQSTTSHSSFRRSLNGQIEDCVQVGIPE
jgi:hypothetical protein